MEAWKDIIDFEGYYQVSSIGRIKSFYGNKDGKLLKPYYYPQKYLGIELCKPNVRVKSSIHRLVAIAFIPNPLNKPQVNHKNLIRDDNRADNLEWVTYSENQLHAIKNNSKAKGLYKRENKKQMLSSIKLFKPSALSKYINNIIPIPEN